MSQFEKGNQIGKETQFKKGNQWRISTKYEERYADELLDYFLDEKTPFPTIEGFAIKIRVAVKTVKNWYSTGKSRRFTLAYEQAMAIQKERLLVGGLTRKFDSQMVKFIAANNHGMGERVQQDTNITFSVDYGSESIDEESN